MSQSKRVTARVLHWVTAIRPFVLWQFQALLIWRFIVGWSIGAGQPAWLAIAAEITPSNWRIITGGLTQTMFAMGDPCSAMSCVSHSLGFVGRQSKTALVEDHESRNVFAASLAAMAITLRDADRTALKVSGMRAVQL